MSFESQPIAALFSVGRRIEIGPAARGVNYGASLESSGRSGDLKWAIVGDGLYSRLRAGFDSKILGGFPERGIEVKTGNAGRGWVDSAVEDSIIDEKAGGGNMRGFVQELCAYRRQ